MSQIELANVVNVSVSAAPAGVGALNTSNLAVFTHEVPGPDFGDDGYKIYRSPSGVVTDFGTDSLTAGMANKIFSQKPNILAGGGYLVVIPFDDTPEVQTVEFSATPTSGSFRLVHGSDQTSLIPFGANAAAVQAALRLLPGFESVTVTGSFAADFVITFAGVHGDVSLLTTANNTLDNGGAVSITVTETTPGVAETLDEAITRTKDLVQYFGILSTILMAQAEVLDAADVVQPLVKILFIAQKAEASVDSGGTIDLLRTGGYTQTRGLLYIGDAVDDDSLEMAAAYAGRALSTAFSGSNTTQTMHLKDLIGVQPDLAITESILTKAQSAGADIYPSIQGVPKVYTSGANDFFDQVYNLLWFVNALQVAIFNALARTSSKLAQTETGVGVLKGAARSVCEQAVTNQYCAPGTWTSPDTFGNLEDFLRNIEERGYYIYTQPVALQPVVDREARLAPLMQIALKEAGAIHKSNVLVNINA